jgi:TolA-binding protein
MKGMKLSKTSWLLLSGGIFVVILAGLGVTRSQQLREQGRMNEELSLSETRLENNDVTDLRRQIEDLQQQVDQGQTQLDDAKERLRQTVISVDVTEEFFKIASYSGVTVMGVTTSKITPNKLEDIGLSTISLSAQVKGDFDKTIDFVINLNHGYATGYVQSAQITVASAAPPAETGGEGEIAGPVDDRSSLAVQMIVYSYEGD